MTDDELREAAILRAAVRLAPPGTTVLIDGSERARALTSYAAEGRRLDVAAFGNRAVAGAMRDGTIGAVFVGADAIAANGDVLTEPGGYDAAVLAAHHRVPFIVLARRSDVCIDDGASSHAHVAGERVPAHLITAIVTEYGAMRPPYADALADLASRPTTFAGGKVWESNPPAPLRGPQRF